MEQNIGKVDKIIRIIAGIGFAALGYYVNPWFYLVAAIALITASTGFCWPYKLLGINTNKPKEIKVEKKEEVK